VNFQVTILKVLVSYPNGFAVMADLKRDMAILATSGRDWAERTKRLALRVPDLDIFSHRLVERENGGWKLTDKGRAVLELMEARSSFEETTMQPEALELPLPPLPQICAARAKDGNRSSTDAMRANESARAHPSGSILR